MSTRRRNKTARRKAAHAHKVTKALRRVGRQLKKKRSGRLTSS